MPVSSEIARSVRLIDHDRREISNAGIAVATRIGNQAQRFTTNAVRYGHDPVAAAKAVLLGNESTDHASVTDVLAHTMLVSNLKGRRRTVINARGHVEPISLARDDLAEKEAALLLLLFLTTEEIADLRAFYLDVAENLVNVSVKSLLEQLGDATLSEIRQRYFDAGFAGADPYQLTNLFETAGQRGYSDGRFESFQNEQIRDALWGFFYSAIRDERTTKLCWTLHGTTLPKDDPFWIRFKTPNHFRCRSCEIEVWKSSALRDPTPIPTRATIQQLVEFAAEKRRFLSYF